MSSQSLVVKFMLIVKNSSIPWEFKNLNNYSNEGILMSEGVSEFDAMAQEFKCLRRLEKWISW